MMTAKLSEPTENSENGVAKIKETWYPISMNKQNKQQPAVPDANDKLALVPLIAIVKRLHLSLLLGTFVPILDSQLPSTPDCITNDYEDGSLEIANIWKASGWERLL